MLARRPLATAAATVTVALMALAVLSGCAAANAGTSEPSAASLSAGALRVAVIGDSIESGLGLDPSEAWPALLAAEHGWRLDNLSEPGAGFLAQGPDGKTFSAQVDTALAVKPELVLIGASDNDLDADPDQVASAMSQAVDRLRTALPNTRIVGFSALTGSATDDDLSPGDAALRRTMADAGGTWLDLGQPYRDRAGLVQDDGEHPTLPGQQAIAAAVEAKLGL
jgi:acyl-CoA thioesterase-1